MEFGLSSPSSTTLARLLGAAVIRFTAADLLSVGLLRNAVLLQLLVEVAARRVDDLRRLQRNLLFQQQGLARDGHQFDADIAGLLRYVRTLALELVRWTPMSLLH